LPIFTPILVSIEGTLATAIPDKRVDRRPQAKFLASFASMLPTAVFANVRHELFSARRWHVR
jgi:hypothetical protein